jgi:hypothetical protein
VSSRGGLRPGRQFSRNFSEGGKTLESQALVAT